jgi:prepilin-type N-terminal cleavage/methylation domain-containing protein
MAMHQTNKKRPSTQCLSATHRRTLLTQSSCQDAVSRRAGFTLLELLVVIVILGILSASLVISVQSSYKNARQVNCKSNLRQFGVALTIYRAEHDNRTPDWISNLYPEYVDDRAMYVCTADINKGRGEPRPEDLTSIIGKNEIDNDKQFWDNEQGSHNTRNEAVEACSYLYEFSAAPTTWKVPARKELPKDYCMRIYKMDQMRYGDNANVINGSIMPYSASRIPIVRCYHHWRDMKILGYENEGAKTSNRTTREYITINVAYAGNVFVGPLWWEGTIHPGDSRD